MSLLMDALKKAEQEKKEAAKRLKEAQEESQDQLQPLEDKQDDRTLTQELITEKDVSQHIQQDQDTQALATPDVDRDKLDDTGEIDDLLLSPAEEKYLVLEDIDEDDSSVQKPSEPIEEGDSLSSTDNIELEISGSERPADLDQTFALADFDAEELEATPLSVAEDTVQAEQALASETLAEAVDEYEYFSATVSAAQLAQDIGGDSPTPVAAQTVFTATHSKPGNQILQWSVFAVLCLAIAVSLSFFVFNYTVPVERTVKSPLVAKDIETQSEPVPTIEIPEELVSDTEIDSSLFTGEITDVIEKENNTVVSETQTENEAANVSGSETAQAMIPVSPGDQLALAQEKIWYPSEDGDSSEDILPTIEIVEKTTLALPEKIVVEPKLIKISRSVSVDKRSVLINKAYQEYLEGDYDSATKSYANVLKELPENRDALLGLAAISIRKGKLRQAYSNYLEVLRLYPGDSVAEAALINFKQNGDYSRNESILKTFLKREPDNSFLYYSLGRLYAVQSRWPEAQQSFFNAHRIETSNPDYAFNLAVSLDHVGQWQSAIDYYKTALDLAGQSTVGFASSSFNRSAVISRISALSGSAEFQ
jgi:tetratricopeptide (TPR) repeat protein